MSQSSLLRFVILEKAGAMISLDAIENSTK